MSANLENSAVATGLEKVSFHPDSKEGQAKECSNYRTIALILHDSKFTLKILQEGFSSMWIKNFQMYKLCFEEADKQEINFQDSLDHE